MTSTQATDVRGAVRFALLAAMVCSGPQLARADQAEPPPAPAQAHDLTRFDEVVVTAQRREQKLQDVGIAVTPLGEKALEDLNITNATDIVRAVPSLKMNAYSSSQVVFPRRRAEQLRRRAGAAGRGLPGRQLLELDQPRELPGIRSRAGRGGARPAGHAVRPQRDGWRDPVHLAQAHR